MEVSATWNIRMMLCVILMLRKVHSLFWTDLEQLSFHSVCFVPSKSEVMNQDWDSPDHRCLRQFAKVRWSDSVSNLKVWKYVLGGNGSNTLSSRIKLCRLRWLGHVLPMGRLHLPRWTLFSIPKTGWKRWLGDQHMTWQREIKNAMLGLCRGLSPRLPGWGP